MNDEMYTARNAIHAAKKRAQTIGRSVCVVKSWDMGLYTIHDGYSEVWCYRVYPGGRAECKEGFYNEVKGD